MNRCRALVLAVAFAASLGACGGGGGSSSAAQFATCGNGQIDLGELCDDGNLDDHDDCTSTCVPARCGDGVIHTGVEDCDGLSLNRAKCGDFGRSGDSDPGTVGTHVRCTADCQYDLSGCGPSFTPTPTPTDTPTPTLTFTPNHDTPTATGTATPTPTATPNPCGDGFLEPPETCDTCPADCQVRACTPGTPTQEFGAALQAPLGSSPSTVAILIGYRSDRVSLPSAGAGSRVKNRPMGSSQLVNNLGYAVRVVLAAQAGSGLPDGQVFTVDFDSCQGTNEVTPADFGCTVESCGSSAGPIDDCTCTVTLPKATP